MAPIELEKSTRDLEPLVADAARRALYFHTQQTEIEDGNKIQSEVLHRQIQATSKFNKCSRSWAIGLLVWGGISLVAAAIIDPV